MVMQHPLDEAAVLAELRGCLDEIRRALDDVMQQLDKDEPDDAPQA
jgi:Tfp pilus assembly protein PilO